MIVEKLKRQKRYLTVIFKRTIAQTSVSAHSVAMGFAIGIFIGLGPTFGFQMIPALAICTLFRCHKIMGMLAVWVTNPFTVVPIYVFNFTVGQWVLSNFLNMEVANFESINYFFEHLTWEAFLAVGQGGIVTFVVGSVVVGLVGAVFSYFFMNSLIVYLRSRKNKGRSVKQEENG